MQAQHQQERSIGELFAELSQEISRLFRQEVALARTEISQKASSAGKDIAFVAGGGIAAFIGALAIVTALIAALALALPLWLSALIVGVVVAVVGYVCIQRGMTALKHMNFAPEATIDTLKEDASWMREQTQ
jgi:uncharacterized protein (DUF983 family)